MNIFRITSLVLFSILLIPIDASAHCAGKHTGNHPHCVSEPPPPPPACNDTFPGFVYTTGSTRKTPGDTRLSSSDGCRTESLGIGDRGGPMHMTADRSKGVIVWVENPEGTNQNIIRRLDFTVDGAGNLNAEDPVTILPLVEEEALPGDELFYTVTDVWGDATHDSLYITVLRLDGFSSGAGTRMALIYDLNTLTNVNDSPAVRTIFDTFHPLDGSPEYPGWVDDNPPSNPPDCSEVLYPQFVPGCYIFQNAKFNPSGTHLYLERNLHSNLRSEGEVYRGFMRINTEHLAAGLPLANWELNGPEMVFASTTGMEGLLPRPDTNPYALPSPEIVTVGDAQFLNADLCVGIYADLTEGNSLPPQSSLWPQCIDTSLLAHGSADSWESPDSYLFSKRTQQGKSRSDIFRVNVSNGLADIEELVIENGSGADTGL